MRTVGKRTLGIFNEAAVRVPRKKLTALYNAVLVDVTDLNVICVGNRFSRKLNERYRGHAAPANVLSFPSESGVAEIYINTELAVKEARSLGVPIAHRILFLCVHGMLHLLGYNHGAVMEKMEDRYLAKYV